MAGSRVYSLLGYPGTRSRPCGLFLFRKNPESATTQTPKGDSRSRLVPPRPRLAHFARSAADRIAAFYFTLVVQQNTYSTRKFDLAALSSVRL